MLQYLHSARIKSIKNKQPQKRQLHRKPANNQKGNSHNNGLNLVNNKGINSNRLNNLKPNSRFRYPTGNLKGNSRNSRINPINNKEINSNRLNSKKGNSRFRYPTNNR